MKWSSQYITILKEHVQEWTTMKGNKDGRTKLVKVITKVIQDYHQENLPEERLPDNLHTVSCICSYHQNWNFHAILENHDMVPKPNKSRYCQ